MLFSVLKSFGFNKIFMIIVALFLLLQFYHISYWYFILFVFILADYFEYVNFFASKKLPQPSLQQLTLISLQFFR